MSAQQASLAATLRQIYRIIPSARRRTLAGLLILMVLGGLAEIAAIASVLPFVALLAGDGSPHPLQWIGRTLAALGVTSSRGQALGTLAAFVLLALLAGAIRLLLAWSIQRFAFRLGHNLAVEVQRRILLQPYSWHIQQNSSRVLAAMEKVDLLVIGVLLQLLHATTALLIGLFILVVLMSVDLFTAAIAGLGFSGLYLLVSSLTAKRLERNSNVSAKTHDERFKTVQESLGGIRDVIIDSAESVYLDTFRRIDRRFADARASTLFIGAAPRPVIEAAGMALVAALALLLWDRQKDLGPALPILGALAVGAFRLLPFVQQLYYSWTMVAGNRAVVGEVLDFLSLPVTEAETARQPPRPLPFNDEIRFRDVTFAYAGAARPALRNVDLAIPRGSRVALVGRTGAGKTTFADILMGLLKPTQGAVLIDGTPLSSANEQSWRRSIAHVPQSIFLADTTIARNVAFTAAEHEIDRARVAEAVRLAQLEEFVDSLPDGLDTRVGEHGVRLSGGQRQRLGIARALYKGAEVLVLDEATNALDAETEAELMRALLGEAGTGRTIIIVSHRTSTMDYCDFVLRLENGVVAEFGEKPARTVSGRASGGRL